MSRMLTFANGSQMSVARANRRVLDVRITGIESGWEQWFLLSSDHHYDNQHTDLGLLKQHHERAKQREALIMAFGDVFCAMQGKYDKRRSVMDVRPEHMQGDDYLDAITRDAVGFYGGYAKNYLMVGKGNHETSILDRCGVDLTNRLVYGLNIEHGGSVESMEYSGYIRFLFTMNKTKRMSRTLYFHHGSGGGGPVTKGVIQTNRQAVYLPDADYVVNGHTHDAWILPLPRERITHLGNVTNDLLWFIRTPSYKAEFGKGGWHDQRWGPPKPLGAVWMRMFFLNNTIQTEFHLDLQQ